MSTAEHLDLSYDDGQQALAESVRGYVGHQQAVRGQHVAGADDVMQFAPGSPDWGLWRGLADLGVLGLGTPEGGGGALEMAAVLEVLGELAAPGPLVGTFMATQLLGERDREGLIAGSRLVSVGSPPLLPGPPWPRSSSSSEPKAPGSPVRSGRSSRSPTLAREPWGRATFERLVRLDGLARSAMVGDVAVAAYLLGAAQHLLAVTADMGAGPDPVRPADRRLPVRGASAGGARRPARGLARAGPHAPPTP